MLSSSRHHEVLPMRVFVVRVAGFNASEVQDFRELFLEMDAGYGVPWYEVRICTLKFCFLQSFGRCLHLHRLP